MPDSNTIALGFKEVKGKTEYETIYELNVGGFYLMFDIQDDLWLGIVDRETENKKLLMHISLNDLSDTAKLIEILLSGNPFSKELNLDFEFKYGETVEFYKNYPKKYRGKIIGYNISKDAPKYLVEGREIGVEPILTYTQVLNKNQIIGQPKHDYITVNEQLTDDLEDAKSLINLLEREVKKLKEASRLDKDEIRILKNKSINENRRRRYELTNIQLENDSVLRLLKRISIFNFRKIAKEVKFLNCKIRDIINKIMLSNID